MDVIAIFDIGKTNKKFLLFDKQLKLVQVQEKCFQETKDDDGFPSDDISNIEIWMKDCIINTHQEQKFSIKAVNFCSYGASVLYLGKNGERCAPLYNYLKPFPEEILKGFYDRYGGIDEFCRCTASPALGMLNLGLQILWVKRKKPELFSEIADILFFPQYLSYCFTGKVTADYTYVGCHTSVWDFDNQTYHPWLKDEGIKLTEPMSNSTIFNSMLKGFSFKTGIGVHDSAASLVPYLINSRDKFMLISTGTWCISMNPFNDEPLTFEQLRSDCLCNRSTEQRQIKSSRLFMGHIHDVNVKRLNEYFGVKPDFYKTVAFNRKLTEELVYSKINKFFIDGVPADYIDSQADLSNYSSFADAYHQLMFDICTLVVKSIKLIIPAKDDSRDVYISGGFARNEIFTHLIAAGLPDKRIFISEIDNASALGAAIVVYKWAFEKEVPEMDLGLSEVRWTK